LGNNLIFQPNPQSLINQEESNVLLKRGHQTIEVEKDVSNGYCMLILAVCLCLLGIAEAIAVSVIGLAAFAPIGAITFIAHCFIYCGFFTNNPNEAHVLTYFGKYLGSVKKVGFFWVNPFYQHIHIPLRRKIFRSEVIKVNDKTGNPILMGCIVVWKVRDTAKAHFDVENYTYYVQVQTETAIRYIGCKYPYEKIKKDDICLRSGHDEINSELKRELTERLEPAGIEVVEAYINEISCAPEIASVMLKRQSAQAIIAAREKIVQGAVSIAGHAVNSLRQNNICELNDEEKSDIVSNLILVLCTESEVRPIVNAGANTK
jgi:regulator of protease activity HflC (stomatin/prohibitin superfamily)